MKAQLRADRFEALRRLDACTLANAIETFRLRLRNEGFTHGATRCLFPQLRPMLGYAATVKIHGTSPPTGGSDHLDRTDWWEYVRSIPGPRVVAVQDVSSTIGLGALLGEVHVTILQPLGCVGAITNGSVRHLQAVSGLGFHLFSGSLSVSHSYVHIVEFGAPVEIDGLSIRSGDLLHGDIHGIQSVPLEIIDELPAVASRITAREQEIVALCRAPGFTIEKLRATVSGRTG